MGSVVIDMSMSLDGYIAAHNDNELEQTGHSQTGHSQTHGVTHLEYRVVRSASSEGSPASAGRAS